MPPAFPFIVGRGIYIIIMIITVVIVVIIVVTIVIIVVIVINKHNTTTTTTTTTNNNNAHNKYSLYFICSYRPRAIRRARLRSILLCHCARPANSAGSLGIHI